MLFINFLWTVKSCLASLTIYLSFWHHSPNQFWIWYHPSVFYLSLLSIKFKKSLKIMYIRIFLWCFIKLEWGVAAGWSLALWFNGRNCKTHLWLGIFGRQALTMVSAIINGIIFLPISFDRSSEKRFSTVLKKFRKYIH